MEDQPRKLDSFKCENCGHMLYRHVSPSSRTPGSCCVVIPMTETDPRQVCNCMDYRGTTIPAPDYEGIR